MHDTGETRVKISLTRGALVAAMLFAVPAVSHAACTQADQDSKTMTLSNLLLPLAQKDAARANTVSEGLTKAMMLDGDEACVALDKLIADAK